MSVNNLDEAHEEAGDDRTANDVPWKPRMWVKRSGSYVLLLADTIIHTDRHGETVKHAVDADVIRVDQEAAHTAKGAGAMPARLEVSHEQENTGVQASPASSQVSQLALSEDSASDGHSTVDNTIHNSQLLSPPVSQLPSAKLLTRDALQAMLNHAAAERERLGEAHNVSPVSSIVSHDASIGGLPARTFTPTASNEFAGPRDHPGRPAPRLPLVIEESVKEEQPEEFANIGQSGKILHSTLQKLRDASYTGFSVSATRADATAQRHIQSRVPRPVGAWHTEAVMAEYDGLTREQLHKALNASIGLHPPSPGPAPLMPSSMYSPAMHTPVQTPQRAHRPLGAAALYMADHAYSTQTRGYAPSPSYNVPDLGSPSLYGYRSAISSLSAYRY
jgi:hypothetical protein